MRLSGNASTGRVSELFLRAQKELSRLSHGFGRFAANESGMGAVEFALLMPLLIFVYLVSFELTIGLSVNKKVTNAASAVADLVTRQTAVDKTYLASMDDVVQAIFVPYGTSGLDLKITGIKIDSSNKATVAWSWENNGTAPYSVGNAITVPSSMLSADTFLVHAELTIPHELLMYLPNMSGSEIKSITLGKDFYYRQRVGTEITCSDC